VKNVGMIALPSLVVATLGFCVACGSSKSGAEDSGSGTPVVVNGGFEDGTVSPWSPFHSIEFQVGGAMVHSGKFSLAESSGGGSLYQDVKGLEVGATYEVSAFIAAAPGSTAIAQLAIADTAGKVPAFSPVVTPTTEWQPVSASVAAIAPGTIRIHLYRYSGSGTVYWDDVQIRHK